MILTEITKTYSIYVDLDGVLANFDKRAEEIIGSKPENSGHLWSSVKPFIEAGEFWSTFELMPDAKKLWNYVKPYSPEILTAGGNIEFNKTRKEKIDWVKKHISPSVKTNVVSVSKEKAKFATPNSILIDDSERSIIPWRMAGGIGILHKSATDTIRELKELGL